MAWFVYDEFNIYTTKWSLERVLKSHRWTRKQCQKKALEASAELRSVYHARRASWQSHRLIFIDESGANERTGDRKFGWSPFGVHCMEMKPVKRSERWSILPALSVNGYLPGTLVYQGSINGELFTAWIRETVLPQCSTDSILIMDNASIHKTPEFLALIRDARIQVEFLPPYSPDFNPIKLSFAILKAWIRRNIKLAENFSTFGVFLRYAVEQIDSELAKCQFKGCGYTLE